MQGGHCTPAALYSLGSSGGLQGRGWGCGCGVRGQGWATLTPERRCNPRGTFVLVFPEKIKVCQVDVICVGMGAGEGLCRLGGPVAASPGQQTGPPRLPLLPPTPAMGSVPAVPISEGARARGGEAAAPGTHSLWGCWGWSPGVSGLSWAEPAPGPAQKASFQAPLTRMVWRIHMVKPWGFCATRGWGEVLGTQCGWRLGCVLHPWP